VSGIPSLINSFLHLTLHTQSSNGLGGAVDPTRIILWGTSYSGGHSLASASTLGKEVSGVRSIGLLSREIPDDFLCPSGFSSVPV
jgi:predicted dienelactone hydrolase